MGIACSTKGKDLGESIAIRPGSSIGSFHATKLALEACGLDFCAATDFGRRLAAIKPHDLPADDGTYFSVANMLLALFDDDRDGLLRPNEVHKMITALSQVFFSFSNCKEIVGTDFSQTEREIAEAELTHDLLMMLYEDPASSDDIDVAHLQRWLHLIEEKYLLFGGLLGGASVAASPVLDSAATPRNSTPPAAHSSRSSLRSCDDDSGGGRWVAAAAPTAADASSAAAARRAVPAAARAPQEEVR